MLIRRKKVFSRLESYKHHDPQPRINYPHFAWPVWRIVFQVGINQNSFKANQLIRDPPRDSYETCQESKGRGLQQLVKRKNFCPGVALFYTCIIAQKRKPEITRMQVNVEHGKLKHCVRLNMLMRTLLSSQPRINYPHFAWPVWRIVFQVGINQNSFKANQLIRDPPRDSYETCQESKGRGLQQLVKRKNFCPGVALFYTCIIAQKRKPEITRMQVNVEHGKLKHCVRLNMLMRTLLSS